MALKFPPLISFEELGSLPQSNYVVEFWQEATEPCDATENVNYSGTNVCVCVCREEGLHM